METASERNWMTREEANAFIGKNASFYMEKWKLHSNSALKGWNWAAMLFGIEWMVYRKMYVEAALSFVIVACISGIASFLLDIDGAFLGDSFRLLIGVFGNLLYRNKALRILHKVDGPNATVQLGELSRRGGVSPISVVIVALMEVAYIVCLLV